jgi:hypothetical protein
MRLPTNADSVGTEIITLPNSTSRVNPAERSLAIVSNAATEAHGNRTFNFPINRWSAGPIRSASGKVPEVLALSTAGFAALSLQAL